MVRRSRKEARIPILLNPRKVYIFPPTISDLVFRNDEVIIRTGSDERSLTRRDVRGVTLNGEKAIIDLSQDGEQITFCASSRIDRSACDYESTNLAVSLFEKFLRGESTTTELASRMHYWEELHKKRVVAAVSICVLGGVIGGTLADWFTRSPKVWLVFLAPLILGLILCATVLRSKSSRYLNRGFTALRRGEADNAIASLHAAAEYIPFSPDVYIYLARAYLLKGLADEAKTHLNKALELEPSTALRKLILVSLKQMGESANT